MFALSDMFDLLANEFACLRGRRFARFAVCAGSIKGSFFGHGTPSATVSEAKVSAIAPSGHLSAAESPVGNHRQPRGRGLD
jgi:hypothetical protein